MNYVFFQCLRMNWLEGAEAHSKRYLANLATSRANFLKCF